MTTATGERSAAHRRTAESRRFPPVASSSKVGAWLTTLGRHREERSLDSCRWPWDQVLPLRKLEDWPQLSGDIPRGSELRARRIPRGAREPRRPARRVAQRVAGCHVPGPVGLVAILDLEGEPCRVIGSSRSRQDADCLNPLGAGLCHEAGRSGALRACQGVAARRRPVGCAIIASRIRSNASALRDRAPKRDPPAGRRQRQATERQAKGHDAAAVRGSCDLGSVDPS